MVLYVDLFKVIITQRGRFDEGIEIFHMDSVVLIVLDMTDSLAKWFQNNNKRHYLEISSIFDSLLN